MKHGLIIGTLMLSALAGGALADLGPLERPVGLGVPPSLAPDFGLVPLRRPAGVGPKDLGAVQASPDPAVAPIVETFDPVLMAAVLFHADPVAARPALSPSVLSPAALAQAAPPVLTVSTSGTIAPVILRPKLRPEQAIAAQPAIAVAPPSVGPLARAFRPAARPAMQRRTEPQAEIVPAAVVRILPGEQGVVGKKGSVCGDPSIKGQTIAPITSRVRGCGVDEAVMVSSVSGVALSEAATIDCNTARALNAWVEHGLQPQFANDPVVQLQVAGHYVCRPRNNVRGAKISEHGRGRAIDISGFVLSSGEVLTVGGDWRSRGDGRLIKAAHKAACGVFNTTLGPGSDGYHEDHLHFDTAQGRGPYCR